MWHGWRRGSYAHCWQSFEECTRCGDRWLSFKKSNIDSPYDSEFHFWSCTQIMKGAQEMFIYYSHHDIIHKSPQGNPWQMNGTRTWWWSLHAKQRTCPWEHCPGWNRLGRWVWMALLKGGISLGFYSEQDGEPAVVGAGQVEGAYSVVLDHFTLFLLHEVLVTQHEWMCLLSYTVSTSDGPALCVIDSHENSWIK